MMIETYGSRWQMPSFLRRKKGYEAFGWAYTRKWREENQELFQ